MALEFSNEKMAHFFAILGCNKLFGQRNHSLDLLISLVQRKK